MAATLKNKGNPDHIVNDPPIYYIHRGQSLFHMEDILKSDESKVVGIIICDPADPISGNTALKYSTVDNSHKGLDRFLIFAARFPTAQYINFYGKKSRTYLGRIYIR